MHIVFETDVAGLVVVCSRGFFERGMIYASTI